MSYYWAILGLVLGCPESSSCLGYRFGWLGDQFNDLVTGFDRLVISFDRRVTTVDRLVKEY